MSQHLSQFELQLSQWERDETLLKTSTVVHRLEVLDELDACIALSANSTPDILTRARLLSSRLEEVNTSLYSSIRQQIEKGRCPSEFLAILRDTSSPVPRGLHYDHLDDLISGVFQFRPPTDDPRPLGRDSVFYQPTPARHIFHLISAASVTNADTLIDLGSGLGHVPLLASICTGATSIGIELDPAWVGIAKQSADALNLHNVTFLAQDARQADLSAGTVFYLYTPFTGSTLASVLAAIRLQATLRSIRICTFGPCTAAVSNQSWLQPLTPPAIDQITVFRPRT